MHVKFTVGLYQRHLVSYVRSLKPVSGIGAYNQTIIHRQALKGAIVGLVGVSSTSTSKSTRVIGNSNDGLENNPMEKRNQQGLPAGRRSDNNYNEDKEEFPSSCFSSADPSLPSANSLNSYTSKKNSAVSRLNRSTKTEAIIGILLLVAVALLVNTGLPASEFQSQLQAQMKMKLSILLADVILLLLSLVFAFVFVLLETK